jgi:hypothetical protein
LRYLNIIFYRKIIIVITFFYLFHFLSLLFFFIYHLVKKNHLIRLSRVYELNYKIFFLP